MAKKKSFSSSGFTPITAGSRRFGTSTSSTSSTSSGPTRAFSMFSPSSSSTSNGSGFTPLTAGGKLAAAQAGTLYSTQQQATAAGYGPTGDYTSKAQSWTQRRRRGLPRAYAAQQDSGRLSLINYYLRSRQTRNLPVMQATTAKEIVNYIQRNPGDLDYSPDRNRIFVTVFEQGAREAGRVGDTDAKEMLLEAAGKARRMIRRGGLQSSLGPYAPNDLQGAMDQGMSVVGDLRARLMAASLPVKAGVALLALYGLKKLK